MLRETEKVATLTNCDPEHSWLVGFSSKTRVQSWHQFVVHSRCIYGNESLFWFACWCGVCWFGIILHTKLRHNSTVRRSKRGHLACVLASPRLPCCQPRPCGCRSLHCHWHHRLKEVSCFIATINRHCDISERIHHQRVQDLHCIRLPAQFLLLGMELFLCTYQRALLHAAVGVQAAFKQHSSSVHSVFIRYILNVFLLSLWLCE